MDKKKDGGPAFPGKSMGFVGTGPFGEATAQYAETPGMTLRDYFAGQALHSIVSHYTRKLPEDAETAARRCYELADAMLSKRDK